MFYLYRRSVIAVLVQGKLPVVLLCLFAFGRVRLHTTVGAKSVKTEVWKPPILMCVCVYVCCGTVQSQQLKAASSGCWWRASLQFFKSLRPHDDFTLLDTSDIFIFLIFTGIIFDAVMVLHVVLITNKKKNSSN